MSSDPAIAFTRQFTRRCRRLKPCSTRICRLPVRSLVSKTPHIKEIGQTEVGMMEMIAYDDNYTGPAFDPAEGERLAKVLGNKTVLFMANHGVTTVGQSVADAYNRLYYIERAAQVQIYAMWTGQRLKQLPEAVIEKTKNEIGGARFYNGPT